MVKTPVIVRKYGGSCLESVKSVLTNAEIVAEGAKKGQSYILVVSAFKGETDRLIEMAYEVSCSPPPREVDMLISVGERISMSLLSMALQAQGCPAISFTGSQAGVLTDGAHNNARILSLRPNRLTAELQQGKVIVLAGFQGVDPKSREITTLGRGGTDTSAIAIASHFSTACELAKDVGAILTAEPNSEINATPLPRLNYEEALEVTFWGAKIIHFRAVELAARLRVLVKITDREGKPGTIIGEMDQKGGSMEDSKVIAINSHAQIQTLKVREETLGRALSQLHRLLKESEIPWPQVLDALKVGDIWEICFTSSKETLRAISSAAKSADIFQLEPEPKATVTATCRGHVATDLPSRLNEKLENSGIQAHRLIFSPLSVTAIIDVSDRDAAIKAWHDFIDQSDLSV